MSKVGLGVVLILFGSAALVFNFNEKKTDSSSTFKKSFGLNSRYFDSNEFNNQVNSELKAAIAPTPAMTGSEELHLADQKDKVIDEIANNSAGLSFDGGAINKTITEHLQNSSQNPKSIKNSIYSQQYSNEQNRIEDESYFKAYKLAYEAAALEQGWKVQLNRDGSVRSAVRVQAKSESKVFEIERSADTNN